MHLTPTSLLSYPNSTIKSKGYNANLAFKKADCCDNDVANIGTQEQLIDINQKSKSTGLLDSLKKTFETIKKKSQKIISKTASISKPKKYIVKFNKLDKTKTYVGLQYGTDNMAKQIRRFSEEYCPGTEAPTHIACFKHENNAWWVYQSSGRANKLLGTPSGTYKIKGKIWAQVVQKKYEIYELDLNSEVLTKNLGKKYGALAIINLIKASIFKTNGKQGNNSGLTCSEYIAMAYEPIIKDLNLPPWCITPAHFKSYFIQNNLKPVFKNF